MKKYIEYILITLFALMILFHILIVTAVLPFDMVWGSRLNAQQVMYFETASILMNIIFLGIILVNAGYLKIKLPFKLIQIFLWSMSVMFILNTVGNVLSMNDFERLVFTPVTLMLTICLILLAVSNKKARNKSGYAGSN